MCSWQRIFLQYHQPCKKMFLWRNIESTVFICLRGVIGLYWGGGMCHSRGIIVIFGCNLDGELAASSKMCQNYVVDANCRSTVVGFLKREFAANWLKTIPVHHILRWFQIFADFEINTNLCLLKKIAPIDTAGGNIISSPLLE